MPEPNGGTLAYKLSVVHDLARDVDKRQDATEKVVERHEVEINGDRGLSKAIDALSEEVKSLRRAIWTVGAGIVISAVGFAFTVLTVLAP